MEEKFSTKFSEKHKLVRKLSVEFLFLEMINGSNFLVPQLILRSEGAQRVKMSLCIYNYYYDTII